MIRLFFTKTEQEAFIDTLNFFTRYEKDFHEIVTIKVSLTTLQKQNSFLDLLLQMIFQPYQ